MKRTVSTLTIELKIQGDMADAISIVDGVLDTGTFQDAINEYASVQVRSVVVRSVQRENTKRKKSR